MHGPENKKRIAIVGSGVVGEATGRGFNELGHSVLFCDIDSNKREQLKRDGCIAISPEGLGEHPVDIFFIAIQTPTQKDGVDLTALTKGVTAIGDALTKQSGYPIVAIRSTVPVGTTAEVITPLLEERSGKSAGVDFGVASNPEYLREKSAQEDFLNPRAITIGAEDEKTKMILSDLYAPFTVSVHTITTREAEMQKYTHNLFNAAKISFFNEQRRVCEAHGLDADVIFPIVAETAEAIWNPRYGMKDLGPYSGACLPKDVRGFIDRTKKELDMDLPLLKAVEEVNEQAKKKSRSL